MSNQELNASGFEWQQAVDTSEENANIYEWQYINPARQSVLDNRDGKIYSVPLVMDGVDTQFAIDTQHKGADKGSFFGKVNALEMNYLGEIAANKLNKIGDKIEGLFQSFDRGIVGSGEVLTTAALSDNNFLKEQMDIAEGKAYYQYSGDPLRETWSIPTEDEQIAAKETVEILQNIRERNKNFWEKAKNIIRSEDDMSGSEKFAEGLGNIAGSVTQLAGATLVTKNPTAAATTLAAIYAKARANEYFDKAMDEGVDYTEAYFNSYGAGLIEGGLELVGDRALVNISKIMPIQKITSKVIDSSLVKLAESKIGRDAVKKIGTRHTNSVWAEAAKGFAVEGGQEGAQDFLGMMYENITGVGHYSKDEVLNQTLFSIAVGGIGGAGVGGVGTSYYNRQVIKNNETIKNILKQQTPELTEQEAQTTADAIQEVLFQQGSGYIDELNNVLNKELEPEAMPEGLTVESITAETRKILKEKYEMSDEDIDKTIKASLGLIDARNQFNEAYSEFFSALTSVGRSGDRADGEARILAARAVTLARAEGTDVNTVLKRWGLRFESSQARQAAIDEQFRIDLADQEFLGRAGVDLNNDSQEVINQKVRDYRAKLDAIERGGYFGQGQIADKAKALFKPVLSEVRKFSETLQKAIRGELKRYTMLQVSSTTPRVYQELGIENKALNLPQNVLKKVNVDKHNVPLRVLERLPELVANPLMVMDSKTEDGSLVSILDEVDADGNTVVAIIKPTDKAYNIIPSIYGKEQIKKLIESSNIRYVNDIEKPVTASIDLASLQLRGGDSAHGNNTSIIKKSDIVNGSFEQGALYQNQANPRGAYQRKGDESIIYLFRNADASTIIHELGHFFLDDMRRFSDNETTQNQLKAIYDFVGSKDGNLTTEQHELFADAFEVYLLDGRSPNGILSKVFARFRKWIGAIYSEVKRLGYVELNDEVRKTFDDMLGGRSLDFAMQISGARMAEALESGIIPPNIVTRAIDLLDKGKMSRADMDDLVQRLRSGELKRKDFAKELKKFEESNIIHHERLNPFDKIKYKGQLERGNFNKKDVIAKIERLLKWTEPRKQGGKLVGRFVSKAMNDKFEHIRKLMAMDKYEARDKIAENVKLINSIIKGEETGDMDSLVFDNKVLSIAAGKANASLILEVYNGIADSYNTGRLTTTITGEAKRKRKARLIGEALETLTNGRTLDWRKERGKLKQFINQLGTSQMSWNGILDILSMNDKSSKTGQSALNRNLDVFEAEQKEALGVAEDGESVSRFIEKGIRGVDNAAISVSRYVNSELIKEFTIEWGKNRRKFTKDQLLDIFMKAQDQETREIMANDKILQYNDDFLAEVNEILTATDRAVANALFEFYNDNYQKINAFYEDKYGISLGKRSFYSPRTMDRAGVNVDSGDPVSHAGFSGVKERTAKAGAIKIKGAFKVLQDYIVNSNHWIAWSDKLIDINAVMGDVEIKNVIRNLFGAKMESRIGYEVSRMASNDKFQSKFGYGELFNKIRSNYAVAVLAAKPALAIKQMTSFPAYWEHMSTGDFLSGIVDFAANMKTAVETLSNTTLMRSRDANPIKDFAELSKIEMFKKNTGKVKLRELMMANIKFGDRFAIYLGGWALYKAELKKNLAAGMKEEAAKAKALNTFERVTDEAQQSGRLSQQSYWQSNPFLRAFTMFQSSQNQYLRKEINAIRGLATGRMDKDKALKTLFIFHVLLPCFFQFASDGFEWDKKAQLRAALLGSLNGIFILNSVLENGLDLALGTSDSWQATTMRLRDVLPFWGSGEDLAKFFVNLAEGDIDLEDYMDAIKGFVKPVAELSGVPVKYPLDVIQNFGNYADEGEYGKEVLLWLGWSPYALREKNEDE